MNNHLNKYFIALVLFIFSACKVSKDIKTPVVELPENFRNASSNDTASIADISYQQFFTDASLIKIIDSAVKKNYDMQAALKNIEAAKLILAQSKYNYLPDATLQVGANINRPSDKSLNGLSLSQFTGKSYIEDYTASIGVSWEADIWGKIKNKKAAALSSYLQTAEARKLIQTNIIANVSQGFYNLLMLDEQLSIAQKNVLLGDSTVQIIKLQFDAGDVTALAVQQAEAQRLVAAQLVPQFEQEITIQENALSILSGTLPAKTARKEILNNIAIPQNISTGVPSSMVSRRPDVRSFELALDIANANTGIAKANMYPSLSITASGGVNAFKISNWFNIPASLFGAVAGSITQPLIQKKQLRTKYEVAKIEREKTVIQFRQSVLNAVGEVSDALVTIEKLREQQTIAVTRRNTLQQAIGNADLLFKNGMATYLEVITAQSNLLQSELETATIKKEQLNANVKLYRALGGGWK